MEDKDVAEMYRRNAELGDTIYNMVSNVGSKRDEVHWVYSDEIRKKAEQLVSQNLDKLLKLF